MTPEERTKARGDQLIATGSRIGAAHAGTPRHPREAPPLLADIEYAAAASTVNREQRAEEISLETSLRATVRRGAQLAHEQASGLPPAAVEPSANEVRVDWFWRSLGILGVLGFLGADAVTLEPILSARFHLPDDAHWFRRYLPPVGLAAAIALLADRSAAAWTNARAERPWLDRLVAAMWVVPILAIVTIVTALRAIDEREAAALNGISSPGTGVTFLGFQLGLAAVALAVAFGIRQREQRVARNRAERTRGKGIEAGQRAQETLDDLPSARQRRQDDLDAATVQGWELLRQFLVAGAEPMARPHLAHQFRLDRPRVAEILGRPSLSAAAMTPQVGPGTIGPLGAHAAPGTDPAESDDPDGNLDQDHAGPQVETDAAGTAPSDLDAPGEAAPDQPMPSPGHDGRPDDDLLGSILNPS